MLNGYQPEERQNCFSGPEGWTCKKFADLSEDSGSQSVAGVALKMTPEQRVEADQLVDDWHSNPEECEAFGARAEN